MTNAIPNAVQSSAFAQQQAAKSLRITCYGSSSSQTPQPYLTAARQVGYLLARRGHVCVNGAGSFGCMAALNDGAVLGEGDIVGVIHKMWLVDQGDWATTSLRDGGCHDALQSKTSSKGPTRQMIVADGDDLQERKRLLVEGADALVVLPGGPGTWDELWEMACLRKLGLPNSLPICCVDVDGYYQPFLRMLERAYQDKLMDQKPEELVKFVPNAEAAVRWCEEVQSEAKPASVPARKSSGSSATANTVSFLSSERFGVAMAAFCTGLALGCVVNKKLGA